MGFEISNQFGAACRSCRRPSHRRSQNISRSQPLISPLLAAAYPFGGSVPFGPACYNVFGERVTPSASSHSLGQEDADRQTLTASRSQVLLLQSRVRESPSDF